MNTEHVSIKAKCIWFINLGEVRLIPGTYNYTFQCMLPLGLPTSVEGKIGYIRYTARVVLDIPMWPDKEFEVPFSVIKAINLDAIPALRVIHSMFAFINSNVAKSCLHSTHYPFFHFFSRFSSFEIDRSQPLLKKIKRFSFAVCYVAVHWIHWKLSLVRQSVDTHLAKLLIWKST